MRISECILLMLLSCSSVNAAAASSSSKKISSHHKKTKSVTAKAWKQARRMTNLAGLFGSPRITAKTPYERVANHPVFQVTTSWGAAYMSFEKVDTEASTKDGQVGGGNLLGFGGDMRPVTLYYMDPEDALAMHQEMKQMDSMQKADIRITATTLAKAIRQSTNLGDGLPTGSPVDALTGKLPSVQDGGSLRYKIVPSKRQLFYAARCLGRERIGQFGGLASDDASTVLDGSQAVDAMNQGRRRDVRNGKSKATTTGQREFRHMEGYTGIPVFYCPSLKRQLPLVKGLLGGTPEEPPIFFSYEDLVKAWNKMRAASTGKKSDIPLKPPNVEVMNMMDVLTSMDRDKPPTFQLEWSDPIGSIQDQWNKRKTVAKSMTRRLNQKAGLDSISFIPASTSVNYKQDLANRGNGKSRLRQMKDWGPRTA
mmetsp:Transcript_5101/g.8371  ORF Transcript_5101/g.8371 Transcript_5101/m.8371 type:complete len:424 (-) Transcript_5101:65-1336(-)|eukprot:CAMPEP_0119014112 /NCGR_PEP_ID=MMETSP1176-20130426/9358_1 /TAXON_ID=265551 /ORGANISM="Synedropsis recta cf, Strain CCMP1620" /LENGTH=423 /DNA_ID=CAMNT_0006967253 /DNA_START=49 /DNA_END=1320 /DNA_ORIENTATION=+